MNQFRSDERCQNLAALPTGCHGHCPLVVAIPDMRNDMWARSINFVQIVALISRVQVLALFNAKEQYSECAKAVYKDSTRQQQLLENRLQTMNNQLRADFDDIFGKSKQPGN